MLIAQGFWDQLATESITNGLLRLWYSVEDFVRNIGPGSLLLIAMAGGALYYFVVRPR